MINEIDKLQHELLQLRETIVRLQNTENTPQIYTPLYRKDLKTRITEKIWEDSNFNNFLSKLDPNENLQGKIKFNIIYEKPTIQPELYKDSIGLTREIIADNERVGYKDKKQYNLVKDIKSGGIYNDG